MEDGNDTGQFIVPTKGSRVFVTFEYNNLNKPLYFGRSCSNVSELNLRIIMIIQKYIMEKMFRFYLMTELPI